jgi:hypothetical protein
MPALFLPENRGMGQQCVFKSGRSNKRPPYLKSKQSIAMKNLFLVLIAASLFMVACQPDDPPVITQKTTAQKLLGKWSVKKINTDYYSPMTVLDDSTRYIGLPGDSMVFKSNNKLYYYEDGFPTDPEIFDYAIINDSTITVDGDPSKLRDFTDTKLTIFSQDIDLPANEKTEYFAYLVR